MFRKIRLSLRILTMFPSFSLIHDSFLQLCLSS